MNIHLYFECLLEPFYFLGVNFHQMAAFYSKKAKDSKCSYVLVTKTWPQKT